MTQPRAVEAVSGTILEQRLADIRRRVRRWHGMNMDEVMAQPGFAYGCIADIALLLGQLDLAHRRMAHPNSTPAPLPALPAVNPLEPRGTPATAVQAIRPALSDPDAWNAALVACRHRVDEVFAAVIRERKHIHDARHLAGAAITGLQRAPPPSSAPVVPPPAEPPPFTVAP